MKIDKFKKLIREETVNVLLENKLPLKEGAINTIINYIVTKLVKSKTKGYFEALAKDPEFLAAKARVKKSLEDLEKIKIRNEEGHARFQKNKEKFAKKFGETKAKEIYDDYDYLYGYKYRKPSWKK
jgi:hypothetical protein